MNPIDFTNIRVATVLEEVAAEREKQRAKWGDDHDDGHDGGELAEAAAFLASHDGTMRDPPDWAYALDANNPPRRRYIIAAALLVAEVERLDRLTERESE